MRRSLPPSQAQTSRGRWRIRKRHHQQTLLLRTSTNLRFQPIIYTHAPRICITYLFVLTQTYQYTYYLRNHSCTTVRIALTRPYFSQKQKQKTRKMKEFYSSFFLFLLSFHNTSNQYEIDVTATRYRYCRYKTDRLSIFILLGSRYPCTRT